MATEKQTTEETVAASQERWDSLELARRIAGFAADKKARRTVVLDVEEALQVTDYFVITSARNRRHIAGVAENIAKELKKFGIHRLAGTPMKDDNWVVLDFGPVVLHVFSPQAREFYDLENLWGECERIPFEPTTADADEAAAGDDAEDDAEDEDLTEDEPDEQYADE
jgi:ribosome-associated protein